MPGQETDANSQRTHRAGPIVGAISCVVFAGLLFFAFRANVTEPQAPSETDPPAAGATD